MKTKLSTILILLSLSASLAFAGEKNKSTESSNDSQPVATAAASAGDQNPCPDSKPTKKAKNHQQQEPTDQEKEFDRVLMGIFG